MAVLSRITAGIILGYLASTSLLVTSVSAYGSGDHHVARHLKHPQARAHRNLHGLSRRQDTGDKKKICSAKKKVNVDLEVKPDVKVEEPKKEEPKKEEPKKEEPKEQPKQDEGNNDDNGGGGGGNAGSGCKAGLAWNDGPSVNMRPWLNGKVCWAYTWSPWPACTGSHCPENVPMLWSEKHVDPWQRLVMGKSWGHVLGFNEPDQDGQANMGVGHAVELWKRYVQPVKARHGSPGITGSPKGFKWLRDFMNACNDCDVDFVVMHWYGMESADFIRAVTEFHNDHPGKPVWITEWACHNYGANQHIQCSNDQIRKFMRETKEWLENTPWIERFAWFATIKNMPGNFNANNRLMSPSGGITDLGRQYIS